MFPFPRRPAVRPLSPTAEALLRGLPRAQAPDGLRTRLLSAHARAGRPPRGAFSLAWEGGRAGVLAGAATTGLVVLVTSSFSGASPSASPAAPAHATSAMVGAGPLPSEVADARVSIVDERFDPRMLSAVGAPGDGGP
jgi:hypothetical protein